MGNFDGIKATINANIKTNGKQEITGNVLNHVLNGMVSATETQVVELSNEIKGISPAPMVSVTHAELVRLRNCGKLVPGMQYRITDYVTTTTQGDTRSAGHQFDIIVTADNENTLNEVARACLHDGDTYFSQAGANLAAWQIWYCLDNDRERFVWAADDDVVVKLFYYDSYNDVYGLNEKIVKVDKYIDDTYIDGSKILYQFELPNGILLDLTADGNFYYDGDAQHGSYIIQTSKGVIYRMIDEWNNDCPYDFKNVLFKRGLYASGGGLAEDEFDGDLVVGCYTFSWEEEESVIMDASIVGNNGSLLNDEAAISGVRDNVIGRATYSDYRENPLNAQQFLNNIVFLNTYGIEGRTFYGCYGNTFGNDCFDCSIDSYCLNNTFGNNCTNNKLKDNCCENSFATSSSGNHLESQCVYNKFGQQCVRNNLREAVSEVTLLNGIAGQDIERSTIIYAKNSNGSVRNFYLGDLADLL